MSNLLAGSGSISVDGTTYQVEGDIKYNPSKVKRESLVGPDGFHGFKETPIPGSISMSLRDAGSLTVADFNAMRSATVVLQLANGKTVIGRSMGTVDSQEVDTAEAKFAVKFEGPSVTEQTGS